MDNRAGEMMVFVRVVEAGNFSEAARLLMMTPSTVSKLIARLEARIGVRLIERSTRRLVLTNEGQFYYERSRTLVSQIDETEQQLAQGNAKPEGLIQVSSSVTFGSAARTDPRRVPWSLSRNRRRPVAVRRDGRSLSRPDRCRDPRRRAAGLEPDGLGRRHRPGEDAQEHRRAVHRRVRGRGQKIGGAEFLAPGHVLPRSRSGASSFLPAAIMCSST